MPLSVAPRLATLPDRESVWRPANQGLLTWNVNPQFTSAHAIIAKGFIYHMRLPIPETITIANIHFYVAVAGATLTSGQCKVGVYNSSLTLIGQTAQAVDTNNATFGMASTGVKTVAMTAESGQSLTVTGGPSAWVYVALLVNGTTEPQIRYAPGLEPTSNFGLSAGTGFQIAYSSTGSKTSLPASVGTLATSSGLLYWVAAS